MNVKLGCRARFYFQAEALLILFGLLNPGCGGEKSEPETIPHYRDIEKGQSLETTYAEQVDFEKREAVLAEKSAKFLQYFHETQELGPEIPDMNDEEKRQFDEMHKLTNITLGEEMVQLRALNEQTLGYVHVGRHGELLYATPESAPGRVRIMRMDEGLELMTIDAGDYRWFYGKVRANGQCVLTDRYRSGADVSRAPCTWPWTDKDGGFVAPGPDSPIATSDPTELVRPSNAVGWLFPTRYHELVCVSPELKPILDCLWVVKNGRGFDIVHSGPTQSGLYARVHGDGRIEFGTPLLGSGNRDWTDATWKILDRKDNPAFDAVALARNQFALPERLEITYKNPDKRRNDSIVWSYAISSLHLGMVRYLGFVFRRENLARAPATGYNSRLNNPTRFCVMKEVLCLNRFPVSLMVSALSVRPTCILTARW